MRAAVSDRMRKEAARAVTQNFIANIPLKQSDIIAGYWPLKDEIDITLVLEILEENGHSLCLPRIQQHDKDLSFRRYKRGDKLYKHSFGVMEPADLAALLQPDVVIVPLLAFDKSGHRIGFGSGYYDRTLRQLQEISEVIAVGVGYDFQQIDRIPSEPHDIKLDCVVTDKGVLVCN